MEYLPYILFGLAGLALLALIVLLLGPMLRRPAPRARVPENETRITRGGDTFGGGATIITAREQVPVETHSATIIVAPAGGTGMASPELSLRPPEVTPGPRVDPHAGTIVLPDKGSATTAGTMILPGGGSATSAGTLIMPEGGLPADGTIVQPRPLGVLHVTRGAQTGQSFVLRDRAPQVIGRLVAGSAAHIQLDSPFISRKHATLSVVGGQLLVTDHGSTSGTLLNGTRLDQERATPLRAGDRLALADVHLELRAAEGV